MSEEPLDTKDMINTDEDFEEAYVAHSQSIYRFLFWRTKNAALSEDLTSTVFEKAWRSRNSFHGGSAKAWFYRIARNVLIDHWRKKQELVTDDVMLLQKEVTEPTIAEELDTATATADLAQALLKLPKQMHVIVCLRFIEGLSVREVASKLDLSESNVRVMQYRALQKLRGYLK